VVGDRVLNFVFKTIALKILQHCGSVHGITFTAIRNHIHLPSS